jgi:formylglycine-generating enzyme required for sulfatase activity
LCDAEIFAALLTKKDGVHTYRLPSEQEWAAAAGDIEGAVYGWCNVNSTQPVKKLKAKNGLYDMVGNVWELTSSRWSSPYPDLVVRCGDWSGKDSCRASYRGSRRPVDRDGRVGFRLLRQP